MAPQRLCALRGFPVRQVPRTIPHHPAMQW